MDEKMMDEKMMEEMMKEMMMEEKKITITLEGYSAAVDAVVKQISTSTDKSIEKRVLTGIAFKVAWDLWDQLMRMSEVEKFVDDLGKVVDRMIEEREWKRR